jgi:hypothetical protein
MINVGDIIKGHANELLGLNKDMSKARLAICKECPLYKETLAGAICNNKLWYNPDTKDISSEKKDGYIRGCGCRLSAKTTISYMVCPVGKW